MQPILILISSCYALILQTSTLLSYPNFSSFQIGEHFNFLILDGLPPFFEHQDLIINTYNDTIFELASIDTNGQSKFQFFAPKHLVRLSQNHPIRRRQPMKFKIPTVNATQLIYLFDTGVNITNPDFITDSVIGEMDDVQGHGTAVASLVVSQVLGVCKNCKIVCKRVLNEEGVGNLSTLLIQLSTLAKPGIILLPFTGPICPLLNDILHELHVQGYTIITAAGNAHDDACNYSPASSQDVITVGSVDTTTDAISEFSNYGDCVDYYADGVNVLTLSSKGTLFEWNSGTSLSAAIVAGLVAQNSLAGYMASSNHCIAVAMG